MRRTIVIACLAAAPLLAPGAHALAQERPRLSATDSARAVEALQRLSPAQQQIIARLRQSGLTKEQVRQRLREAGYDPNLADRYFDELNRPDSASTIGSQSRLTRQLPQPSNSFVSALRRIGVLQTDDDIAIGTVPVRVDTIAKNTRPKRPERTEPQIFGRDLFSATTQFEPVVSGPVDPGYKLGPGDEVTLIVTGDVELMYDLTVTREGYVVIPDVGQVLLNGLTMDEAKRRMNERLGRVYSGVQVGTTQADLTVGRVRNKLVYVIGDVEVPNAYQMSGTATVFHALYRAGGPSRNGSFRRVEVRRGNQVIKRVDLYDYLLKGDKSNDVTLEQGDIVFVPVVGSQVTVTGSVRRPGIFELYNGEGLQDALRFAGGVEPDAVIERVQIDRILPPAQRTPGHERVLVDVVLADVTGDKAVPMQDGDRVVITTISSERRNRVAVRGDIQRPGEYEYHSGMTAQQLIDAAAGLLPTAFTPAAHIIRLNPQDSTTSLIRLSLADANAPDYASRVVLQDLDEVVVFGRAKLSNPKKIDVFGYVKNEGTYAFSEGMTAEDVVLQAGGFKEGAFQAEVEVARRVRGAERDSLATVYRIPIAVDGSGTKGSTNSFRLQDGDQIFIRKLPGYEPLSTVEVAGEVMYPGNYTLSSRSERVSDVIERAGGLTPDAYARGFRLFRDGKPVGVNFPKAMSHQGGDDDISLEPGDRIEVPRYDPTVLVTGAVAFESKVRFESGLGVEDYLARAGGVNENGDMSRAAVRYPNGELRTASRVLGIRRFPKVQPGSTISVPAKPEGKEFDFDKFLTKSLAVISTLATVALTVHTLK